MAAVFDFDAGFRSQAFASIDAGLDSIEVAVATLGPTDAVAQLQRAQRRLAGVEARLLAEHITSDGNTRTAEKLLGDGKTSRSEQRRRARRAKAVAANSTLADKLADDELSQEQLDLIADAADKSDGDAATDDALIGDIAAADPDQGRTIKDDWLADRATADGAKTEHERQRALRRYQSFHSRKNGLMVNMLEGDGVSHRAIDEAIRARSKEIYRRDGGSDVPMGKHPRTRAQREFDAAYELLCGVTTNPDGSVTPAATDDQPHGSGSTETFADGSTPGSNRVSAAAPSRPQIVIGMDVDKFIGRDPASVARQIGLGVIPDSVLGAYAEHADIFAALFDRSGEPLWFARLRRNASTAQFIALVIRDKGCVKCGASHTECDVHHRIPWNAPAKGETNIVDLILLCRRCHTHLDADKLTLFRDPVTRLWQTRPATPDETPPARPQRPPPQRE